MPDERVAADAHPRRVGEGHDRIGGLEPIHGAPGMDVVVLQVVLGRYEIELAREQSLESCQVAASVPEPAVRGRANVSLALSGEDAQRNRVSGDRRRGRTADVRRAAACGDSQPR